MASLFKVKALYDFAANEDDDLGFPAGQIIDVTEEIDENWLEGKYTDAAGAVQSGIFPREFVEKYEPEVPARPTRPVRPKQDAAPQPAPDVQPAAPVHDTEEAEAEDDTALNEAAPVAAISKPQSPQADVPAPSVNRQAGPAPSSAAIPVQPPAPKPTAAEPLSTPGGKKPPPIAAKSNAFRDRIAAFNQSTAAPLAPIVPGGPKSQSTGFIKKPFVAPPPMANSYVPPPKVDPVHKPYMREEDPEIKRRQEEDRAAAEAAGLTNEPDVEQQEDDEDAPKPTSLKERIARLQQQQLEQAQRRAEGGPKKEKKVPSKKPSESEQAAVADAEEEEVGRQRSMDIPRQSLDVSRDKPRVPSVQRRPQEPRSQIPPAPEQELVSDGNEADQSAAGETTEDDTGTVGPEDSDEDRAPAALPRATGALKHEADLGDEEDTTEDVEEDEDSMDEDTRRRMELRERMAKMSGGMGMAGMFGPAGGMPLPGGAAKRRAPNEKKPSEDEQPASLPQPPQGVPMIPVFGRNRVQSPDSSITQTPGERRESVGDGLHDERDEETQIPPPRRSTTEERGPPPPVPRDSRPTQERGAPPPVPLPSNLPTPRPTAPDSRPVPPPPAIPMSPGPGSESDDEASIRSPKSTADTPTAEHSGLLPIRTLTGGAPPVPGAPSSDGKPASYFSNEPTSAASDKRASRPPPPVPGSPVTSPRPPPPPPPTAQPSRSVTMHQDDEEQGESDYEGDYDTDIASSAKHKDALKAHVREPSLDDSTTADETPLTPPMPPPHTTAPRAVPPPPPSQPASRPRPSLDAPRGPPPVPQAAPMKPAEEGDDEDYDPYRYDPGHRGAPPPMPSGIEVTAPAHESTGDDQYLAMPTRPSMDRPPPPPPHQEANAARAPLRQSLDVQRSNTTTRRSGEQPRPSGEHGQIANDIDLGENTQWYTDPQPLPPVLQSRNGIDVLSECEESTTSKRGGRTTVVKDIYALFIDYSQTVITVQYDSKEPSSAQLEQRHLPPPPRLRQDQLEAYWQRFGSKISDQANSLGNSKNTVGDGSPAALVSELIKSQHDALQPIGQRAYGALVYGNLANASTMQFDEIRPGDIVTLRNARFEGSHGAMKHKYKQEYGASHVAIVEEWDGTRRAIRAWEQGREKKEKVRSEKFRLGDLKSGEVRVWRVVGRDWVDWQS